MVHGLSCKRIIRPRRYAYFLPLLFLILILSGCAGGRGTSGSDDEDVNASEMVAFWENDAWKTKGFALKDLDPGAVMAQVPPFREVRFAEAGGGEADFTYESRKSMVSYLGKYRFELISYGQAGGTRLYLERRSSDTEEPGRLELFAGEQQKPEGSAVCMDVVSETDIAILFVEETGQGKRYRVAHMDGEGNILSCREVSEGYRGQGLDGEDIYQGSWWCDETGASYLVTGSGEALLVFDENGAFVMRHPLAAGPQDDMDKIFLPGAFHAPDGSLIFVLHDMEERETRLVRLDISRKRPVLLAALDSPYLRQFTISENGMVYYSDANRLWQWDVQTGRREALFSYLGSDIPGADIYEYVEHVAVKDDGELLLYVRRWERTEMYALSDREPEQQDGIVLLDFIGQPYVQNCVVNFNKTHDEGNQIVYDRVPWDDAEAAWTRTLAEFAAGKGPDMLCVWAGEERIDTLYEKGLLEDLADYIPQETLAQYFPGVLASGTVDGHLVGIGISGHIQVLIVSEDLWQEDSWTDRDILDIVEARQELDGIYLSDSGETSPDRNLHFLALAHLEQSRFVDWEKGESHFESEEFQRLLEVSKKYGGGGMERGQASKRILNGDYIATDIMLFYPEQYLDICREYKGKAHFMGFPGQTGYTGYWGSVYLILVNPKAPKSEVADFLQCFTASENLRKYGFMPAREDIVRENLQVLIEREICDESEVEEIIRFLRKVGPWFGGEKVIEDIISQEMEAYFAGDRDVTRTAEIIDNRVQLYLDERK